jgi:hypothetical protein
VCIIDFALGSASSTQSCTTYTSGVYDGTTICLDGNLTESSCTVTVNDTVTCNSCEIATCGDDEDNIAPVVDCSNILGGDAWNFCTDVSISETSPFVAISDEPYTFEECFDAPIESDEASVAPSIALSIAPSTAPATVSVTTAASSADPTSGGFRVSAHSSLVAFAVACVVATW